MIQVADVLLSRDLFDVHFVCDLAACRGECCVQGESGAPLEFDEIGALEDDLDKILPFVGNEGKKALEENGVFSVDSDNDYVSTLINNTACAFSYKEDDGTYKCGIEAAQRAGEINFQKPISCHLYPIRVSQLLNHEALNYNKWSICKPACECGSKLQVKVYQFLKEPLVRKYGEDWYAQLKEVDILLQKEGDAKA